MKKIFIFAAVTFTLLLTACNGCNNKSEELPVTTADSAVVITTEEFEDMINIINAEVHAKYPNYEFYEAYGILKNADTDDPLVEHDGFKVAYGNTHEIGSVVATIVNDTLHLEETFSPWLEDRHMSPYVPLKLFEAVEKIQKKYNIDLNGQPVVLRHQLSDLINEPQYIFGSWDDCHSITVYSEHIDLIAFNNKLQAAEPGIKE